MNVGVILQEFREALDDIMLRCMHDRIVLYGYESYTGRFIKWYAKYYHNIDISYLVSTDMSRGRAYDKEIFRPSIIDFNYRDISQCVIWVVEPMTDEIKDKLEKNGFIANCTYYDFYQEIYEGDYEVREDRSLDAYNRKKTGRRDIQFLEWLEWKFGCNFVNRIPKEEIINIGEHNSGYGVTTQKEIFEILDKTHCHPTFNDAIFDFGCGKGGALISFLDYGFSVVGGVEYDKNIYGVLTRNFDVLDIDRDIALLINDDASNVREVLDDYNWFYFYLPFDCYIFEKVFENIVESISRRRRKINMIIISPIYREIIENSGLFQLTTQFTIDLRQRVVSVYQNKNH